MGSIDSLISVSFLLLYHVQFKIELPFAHLILIISLQSIPQLLIVSMVLRDAQSTGLMFLFQDRKVSSRQLWVLLISLFQFPSSCYIMCSCALSNSVPLLLCVPPFLPIFFGKRIDLFFCYNFLAVHASSSNCLNAGEGCRKRRSSVPLQRQEGEFTRTMNAHYKAVFDPSLFYFYVCISHYRA